MSYHSALAAPLKLEPVSRVEHRCGVAFVHDLMSAPTLPAEYLACDVFYTDLPWRDGLVRFDQRAGVSPRMYADFMGRVRKIVESLKAPCILVTGKSSLKYLMPDEVHSTRLNGAPAVAATFGLSIQKWPDVLGILEELACRFGCVGDFCCGYGRSARAFAMRRKQYVVSDYNAECIGYIRDHGRSWE